MTRRRLDTMSPSRTVTLKSVASERPRRPGNKNIIWAAILIFFGLFFTINAAFDLYAGNYTISETDPRNELKGVTTAGVLTSILITIGLFPLAGGIYMIKRSRDAQNEYLTNLNRWSRSSILRLAATCNGLVTINQSAAYMGINSDEARILLDDMAVNGTAEITVDQDGQFVYLFHGVTGASGAVEKIDH